MPCHPERSEGSPQLFVSVLSVRSVVNPELPGFFAPLRMTGGLFAES
jgi:hypothetical protein